MTQADKELLLKDLCARLPYGVKVKFGDSEPAPLTVIEHDEFGWQIGFEDEFGGMVTIVDNIKPYLFPMSKVVEEIVTTSNKHIAVNVDFFHKNHIDYRGLIEKGLANDATGLNIY